MVKTRLITGATVAAGLLAALSFDFERHPRAGDDDASRDESKQWQRFSQRCSSDSLRTISPPEADFIADERDSNRLEDFWTADVAGLCTTSKAPDPCDKTAETCASALLARSEEGWVAAPEVVTELSGCHVNDFWTTNVAGLYTMTSAAVLMPGTDHALRLIEFSVASTDEDEGWNPEAP